VSAAFLDFGTVGPEDLSITALTDLLPDLRFFDTTPTTELHDRIRDAEILLVNKVRLNRQALLAATQLKLICLAATGTDNIDLDTARERGIAVCNIRNYCTPSVVQHTWSLILALTQQFRGYDELISGGAWPDSRQFCLLDFSIRELSGKTMGIVGPGSLGRGVANIARAFGMSVIAAGRANAPPKGAETINEEDIEFVSLDALLQRADIVSLHCPLTPETENLINTKSLRAMRNDALLINTARGGLIDSNALVDALKNGEIAGAAVDVLRQEPPAEQEPVMNARLPNLIVTPHIAWAARESRQRAIDEIVANIQAFRNDDTRNRVV
jgi:glycerate dehydrogenase